MCTSLQLISSLSSKFHSDPYQWLQVVVPFWEASGFINSLDVSRLEKSSLLPLTLFADVLGLSDCH